MYKPGDRVIFLNEKGGGVVTKVINDQIVHVAVEDGFEIPYAVTDLLRTATSEDAITGRNPYLVTQQNDTDAKPLYSIPNKLDQRPEGVYLALVPDDQENVLAGEMDMVLVNHSRYQLLYCIFLNKSGTYHGFDFGYLEPDSMLSLESIGRNGIEDWSNGLVQLVFFMDGKAEPLDPASSEIAFKPVKVYKDDSFRFEGLIRKKAMFVELATIDKQARKLLIDEVMAAEALRLKEPVPQRRQSLQQKERAETFLDKHRVDDKIAEVDLHIGELTDDFSKMSNVEMMNIQMDYFRRCMDEARSEKLIKIIFIHGVGNGTLKNEISRFLRQSQGIDFYDAPFARYGMGATEVLFYKHV